MYLRLWQSDIFDRLRSLRVWRFVSSIARQSCRICPDIISFSGHDPNAGSMYLFSLNRIVCKQPFVLHTNSQPCVSGLQKYLWSFENFAGSTSTFGSSYLNLSALHAGILSSSMQVLSVSFASLTCNFYGDICADMNFIDFYEIDNNKKTRLFSQLLYCNGLYRVILWWR